jgi:hypothetical protein
MIVELPRCDGRAENGSVEQGRLLVQLGRLVVGRGGLHQGGREYLILVVLARRFPVTHQ